MSLKQLLRTSIQKRLANLPDKKGIKFLLRLENKFEAFLLGVIKIDEMKRGLIHPRHTITSLTDFLIENVKPSDKILDVGCGYGFNSNKLAEKAKFVLGVDLRPDAISTCKKRFKRDNLKFVCKDISFFDINDKFDVIVLSNVLEHIEERIIFLKQCGKIANKIIITVPAYDRDWKVPYKEMLNIEWRKNLDHKLEYTDDILTEELTQANFKIKKIFSKWGNYCCTAFVKDSDD